MKWILDDLVRAYHQLCKWQTWLVIGLLALFAGLAYLVARLAFRTDSILIFLHRTAADCREMNNGAIIFLFCGMIFFILAAVATLGEFQRYFEFRRYGSHHQAASALQGGVLWACVATAITIGALIFFNQYCR